MYDSVGQIISETLHRHHSHADIGNHNQSKQAIISQTLTQSLQHSYDEVGNRIATTLPDGKRLMNRPGFIGDRFA